MKRSKKSLGNVVRMCFKERKAGGRMRRKRRKRRKEMLGIFSSRKEENRIIFRI